jgi:hypothetical protein
MREIRSYILNSKILLSFFLIFWRYKYISESAIAVSYDNLFSLLIIILVIIISGSDRSSS